MLSAMRPSQFRRLKVFSPGHLVGTEPGDVLDQRCFEHSGVSVRSEHRIGQRLETALAFDPDRRPDSKLISLVRISRQ